MDNKNIFERNKFSGKKITYYILLGLCIISIAAISFFSYKSMQNSLANEKIDNSVTDKTDTVNQNVENVEKQPNIQPEPEPEPEQEPEPQPKPNQTPEVVSKPYIMPVQGKIMTEFSLETPIYSKTLKDWRIHDGIDISASLGDNVVAVNDGVIEKIHSDDLFGIVVIVKHTDGRKSTYSNLADNVELEEGQIINQGDIIGKVGESAISELSEGPHLHFELSDNGKKINPLSVIKTDS